MSYKTTLTRTKLREQRLQELLQSCEEQMLAQIIGPFGLTKAMFEDKDGGNVTTLHNFKSGVTANTQDQERQIEWKKTTHGNYARAHYDQELPKKRKELFHKKQPIISAYTSKELARDGSTHLDHVVSAKVIENDPRANLFMSQKERVRMANQDANLKPVESNINQSLGAKDKLEWAKNQSKKDQGKTNAQFFDVSIEAMEMTVQEAHRATNHDLSLAQLKKQGSDLAKTGAWDAGHNALRQALGVLLHQSVTGLTQELRQLMQQNNRNNIVDDMIEAIKRVFEQVISRLREALDAAVQGGVQGFASNLLTFLINNLVTTSAKIVTAIREGMKGLWRAVKILIHPPQNMSRIDVCREVTKIIAGVLTVSIGMVFEESLKTLLVSTFPILSPLVSILSAAISAILTGIGTALVIYTLDRFFDWLAQKDTVLLQAYENNIEGIARNIEKMVQWVSVQYQNSQNY